jgi:hypothetical protein
MTGHVHAKLPHDADGIRIDLRGLGACADNLESIASEMP